MVQKIHIEIFRLLGIDVDTGYAVLDLFGAVLLLAIIFAGIWLLRTQGTKARRRNSK
jgi:hypothetical protein